MKSSVFNLPASALRLFRRGLDAWRRYGTRAFAAKTADYIVGKAQQRFDPVPYALAVDWRVPPRPRAILEQPLDRERPSVNWVVPTIGQGGGHRTIFRFIRHLHERGYRQRIYEMPARRPRRSSRRELRQLIEKLFGLDLPAVYLDFETMQPADIAIATSWQTAYAVFQMAEARRKVYLVQDYEPYFTTVGTESALAENTYRFGFHGITAGPWLAGKLRDGFAMQCDHFNLAADPAVYYPKNNGERRKVFFYARPATPRRGFELGVRALELFHARNPQYEIVFAGGEVHRSDFAMPVTNIGYAGESQLNDIYSQSAAALVVSLTNCSLLPLEIMATGCPVVTTAGDHNQQVLPPDSAIFVPPSPHHLAQALETAVRQPPARDRLVAAGACFRWEEEAHRVEGILQRLLAETPALP